MPESRRNKGQGEILTGMPLPYTESCHKPKSTPKNQYG